jgi:hypothetical protein
MKLRPLLLLMVLPFFAACSVYHPLKNGLGYIEMPVGPDAYQISFVGDLGMSATEARRFALLRAAELAALRDMPYFRITEEHIIVNYGSQYWPGTVTPIVETVPTRHGGTGVWVAHVYEPGYMEYYIVPEAEVQVQLTADPAAPSIPAAYLLQQAIADNIKLSPGVANHMAALPPVTGSVTIPPPPAPTTKPESLEFQPTTGPK